MRVVLAPDSFTGTLTARAAAEAMADGWRRRAPSDELELCPLSDGGPGFVEVLHAALGGTLLAVTVPGPFGEPVPAEMLLVQDGGTTVAYVESAQACGLHLVPEERRDPTVTSSAGVATLVREARAAGAQRIVVGLGGSGSTDAGAGMLAALGAGDDLSGLPALRESWAGIDLVVASDVDAPLLGAQGAALGFSPQKGATEAQARDLEVRLTDFSRRALDATGLPQKLLVADGAGAAGGLGFGLFLLGARREIGAMTVIEAVGLAERIKNSELVVTGEGCFDWQSLRGKVVTGVARTAMEIGTPAIVIAGQVLVGRRESVAIGIEATYAVARDLQEVPVAMADPVGSLAARAERVARTWSHR